MEQNTGATLIYTSKFRDSTLLRLQTPVDLYQAYGSLPNVNPIEMKRAMLFIIRRLDQNKYPGTIAKLRTFFQLQEM